MLLGKSVFCFLRHGSAINNVASRSYNLMVTSIDRLQLPGTYPEDIEYPEKRQLKVMESVPPPLNGKLEKMEKRLIDIRGPEEVHTFLLHKQFGIRALGGGQLRHAHFEMLRRGIRVKFDESRLFAIWRVDAPWKAITKKGQGKRMGGGKGSIDHYVSPVKSGRIIMELGGKIEFEEAYSILRVVAEKLPFKADVVSQEILEREKQLAERLEKENLNPFSFKQCVENNLLGCRKWISPYDEKWHGKYA